MFPTPSTDQQCSGRTDRRRHRELLYHPFGVVFLRWRGICRAVVHQRFSRSDRSCSKRSEGSTQVIRFPRASPAKRTVLCVNFRPLRQFLWRAARELRLRLRIVPVTFDFIHPTTKGYLPDRDSERGRNCSWDLWPVAVCFQLCRSTSSSRVQKPPVKERVESIK